MPGSSRQRPAARAPIRFRVVPREHGMLLRNLLARRLAIQLAEATDLIKAGGVYVDNVRVRAWQVRVSAGARVTAHLAATEVAALDPSALRVVWRDEWCLVIDKPAGIPVTPTVERARGSLSDAVVELLARSGLPRPYVGAVHRLDRRASGLVLFTIRSAANASLHRQFVEHRIHRDYVLELEGDCPDAFSVARPLRVAQRDGHVYLADPSDPRAEPAQSEFGRIAGAGPPARSLARASLVTGRTHQLRVHAASAGYPIVGDLRYGATHPSDAGGELARLALHLHGWRLEFAHPISGRPVRVEASDPEWLTSRWASAWGRARAEFAESGQPARGAALPEPA